MNQQSQEKLLPCPFCGGEAITSTYYIECECDMQPRIDWFHSDKQKAINVWNARTHADAAALLAEVEKEIKEIADYQQYGDCFDAPAELELVTRMASQTLAKLKQFRGE